MRLILYFLFVSLAVAQPNRVVNPSFETVEPTNSNLASGWQVFGGPYVRNNTTTAWDKSYTVQVGSGGGAVQHVVLNQPYALPIRISVRVKGSGIVDDPNDKLGASLDCKIYFHDNSIGFCPATVKTKSVGTFDWKWVGYNTANIGNPYTPIDSIDFRVRMGAVAGTAWFDDAYIQEYIPGMNGMVTFMF